MVISDPLMREIEMEVKHEKGKLVKDEKGRNKDKKKKVYVFVCSTHRYLTLSTNYAK